MNVFYKAGVAYEITQDEKGAHITARKMTQREVNWQRQEELTDYLNDWKKVWKENK